MKDEGVNGMYTLLVSRLQTCEGRRLFVKLAFERHVSEKRSVKQRMTLIKGRTRPVTVEMSRGSSPCPSIPVSILRP